MTISFIPNDPKAGGDAPALRTVTPRPDRPANQAGVVCTPALPPESVYPITSKEFTAWQSREAVLATLDAFESINGAALAKWGRAKPNARRLKLLVDAGEDLNAFYDGQTLSFFHNAVPGRIVFSGASTDVVAHETGHGLLDATRPQLFDVNFPEAGALHEAVADVYAILTALHDKETRQKLLVVTPDLGKNNFVETTAEDLSDAVKALLGPTHPAAKPRQAFNKFKWQLPTTLPSSAPPDQLSNEVHSFARVFSGCCYDTIRKIFVAQPTHNEATLLKVAILVGKLIIAGTKNAPLTPRLFRSVGRAMVLADQTQNGGANKTAIGEAFADHGIALGSSAMLAPFASLEGAVPTASASLSTSTKKDLLERFNAPKGAKLIVDALRLGAETIAHAVHDKIVSLADVHPSLKGVIALAPEAVMVGAEGGRAAILGNMPDETSIDDEVKCFVEMLVKHGRIESIGKKIVGAVSSKLESLPTHAIKKSGTKKVLTRLRFACRHCL